MEWIVTGRALKPSGQAFIIVPDGLFNRQNNLGSPQRGEQKNFLLEECYIIISLPKKTFFTTSKKTSILCITKKYNNKMLPSGACFHIPCKRNRGKSRCL
uniref:DNA methylase adenine-specific domain-containing protein n=1 Tax=Halimeda minima TaxID=170427 RepID=A0A386AZ30_9CHLO|nr:hypothetical protein [Halimeda minima]